MANKIEKSAGMLSLPPYLQDAANEGYINLKPAKSAPIIYGKINAKKSTDEVISSTSAVRDSVNSIFFKNSGSLKQIDNIFLQVDTAAKDIALRHYTSTMGNSNIALAMHGLDTFNSMISKGVGEIISTDTETFGMKGTAEFPGITELAYYKRKASVIKNAKDMKSLFDGKLDEVGAKQSFLFGLSEEEYSALRGIMNKAKLGTALSNEEAVSLKRLALYSDAKINYSKVKDRFIMDEIGSDIDEFIPREKLLDRAEMGLNRLSGKAAGFERMKDQTVRSQKAHDFMFDWLRQVNDVDNLNLIYNYSFDAPLMNDIIRNAFPFMDRATQARFLSLGGEVKPGNIFDPMEIFNARFGNNPSSLYMDTLGATPAMSDKGLITLENITETIHRKVMEEAGLSGDAIPKIHHQADIDAKNAVNILSYRKNGKLIFSGIGEDIKDNLKHAISENVEIEVGKDLNKGDLLYFMSGIKKGPLDGKVYNNASHGEYEIDKANKSKMAVGSKEVLKFDGVYKGDVKKIMKELPKEQQSSLLNAINSGAMKDNFMVAVLKDAYNQSVMIYGNNEWELSRKLQPGFVIGKSLGSGSFANGSVAIDKSAMGALGATETDLRLRAQGMIGDIDKAQRRYNGWFDLSEGGRSITQAKLFYSTAKELRDKGITKEDFFNIAFNGQTIKGVEPKYLSEKLARYEYNKEVHYSPSRLRDMYHMYDRLGAEADLFIPAIQKIESTFGDFNGSDKLIKAKAIMSSLHKMYDDELEAAGVSQSTPIIKLGYEKNVVAIPKNLFNVGNVEDAISALKNGADVDSLAVELNLGNMQTASTTVKNMVEQVQKDIGATHNSKFPSFAVNRLAEYLVGTEALTKEQAEKVLKVNSSNAFVKAQDLLNLVKKNRTYSTTMEGTFDILDMSAGTAAKISKALTGGVKNKVMNSADDVISDVIDNFFVINRSGGTLEKDIADMLRNSSWAKEMIKNGASSKIYDSTKMAEGAVSALSESLARIAGQVQNGGKDFQFAIHRTKGKKYNTYHLVFGTNESVLNKDIIDTAANIGRVELGTILDYQGVPVMMKGGYKKVAASHLDSYKAFKGGFDANELAIYDSYSYSLRQLGIASETISDAIIHGDMDRASSRASSQLNKVYEKLKSLDSNVYDETDSLKATDMEYAMKMYMDDRFKALGLPSMGKLKELDSKGTQISTLNKVVEDMVKNQGGIKSLASKVKNNKEMLDADNITQAIRIMLKDSNGKSVSPIAQEIAKWSAAAGMPVEQVVNLMFAAHEGDANKAFSAWGMHPSEFHPLGWMTANKRPVIRQTLSGPSFYTEDAKTAIKNSSNRELYIGSPFQTEVSNAFKSTIERHSGQAADRVLTGNVLFMSQETFDSSLKSIVDNIINDPRVPKKEKERVLRLQKNLQRLSVNNGESIVAREVADILAGNEIKEYRTNSSFQFHKSIIDKINNGEDIFVTKHDVLGYQRNSSGLLDEVTASGTGELKVAEDGRLLLRYTGKTNDVMKVGVNSMEKSVAMALDVEETDFLRKHFGNFSIIMNNELGKHEAFNLAYNDLFSKKYYEIQNSKMSPAEKAKALKQLEKDMNSSLGRDGLATLAKDDNGNVTGIKLLSHDFEHESYGMKKEAEKDLSRKRIRELLKVQERYASEDKSGKYDIVRKIAGKEVNAYTTTISGMQMIGDIEDDRGVKFDTRVMESLLRQTDKDGESVLAPFVSNLYKKGDKGFVGGHVRRAELERLDRAYEDVDVMSKFLNMYKEGVEVNPSKLGSVKEYDSILDMPFYRSAYRYGEKTDWPELTDYMFKHGRMFGEGNEKGPNFVKVKLGREVRLKGTGQTIDELYLPNVNMAHMGEVGFKSTNYQKSISELINAAVDVKNAAELGTDMTDRYGKIKDVELKFQESVNKVYDSIKLDFGAKDGIFGSMFNVRLKHSGIALNKEISKAIGAFTAGKEGNEDIVYISQSYAERLLGDKFSKFEKILKNGSNTEESWGMYGMLVRYPTILERSPSVVKYRIADGELGQKLLGKRQIAQFRHTSYGSNADVDSDQMGVIMLDPHEMTKGERASLMRAYEFQKKQNTVAQMFIADEYSKTNGLAGSSKKTLNFKQTMAALLDKVNSDEKFTAFTSRLGREGVQEIYEAFRSKSGVGKANIPSFYLRQHAIEAFNKKDIKIDDLKLVAAFSESAEQKMIDAIKKEGINAGPAPIDTYFEAMKMHDADKLVELATSKELGDKISTDVVKRYAYHTGNTELAQKIINGDTKAIQEQYSRLPKLLSQVMESSSYKKTSMQLAVDGNLTDEALKEVLENSIVSIKGSAQDIISGNLGYSRLYQEAASSTDKLVEHLQNHGKRGIIGETADTASGHFKQAMNDAGERGKEAASKVVEFLKSDKAKRVGVALAAISLGSMAIGALTSPSVNTRKPDDVGLTADEAGPMPVATPAYTASAPVIIGNKPMNGIGLQININAANNSRHSTRDIQNMIRSSFGGDLNIKMNINDNSNKMSSNYINDMMMNSIS